MHYRSRSSLAVGGGKLSGGRPKADCRWQIALGPLDRLGRVIRDMLQAGNQATAA